MISLAVSSELSQLKLAERSEIGIGQQILHYLWLARTDRQKGPCLKGWAVSVWAPRAPALKDSGDPSVCARIVLDNRDDPVLCSSCIDSPIPHLRWGNLLRERVFSVFLWHQSPQHPWLLHVQKPTAVCLQISWLWALNLMYCTASAREFVPPMGSVPAQTLLHKQGRVIPPCICPLFPHSLMYLSRTSEAHSLHCPAVLTWWLCHRQRDSKIMSLLYDPIL